MNPLRSLLSARRGLLPSLILFLLATPSAVAAQWARRPLPEGEAGLEMSIEGATTVAPGASLTYLLALYEIRGDDFRPASGASIRALASFAPSDAVASVETDAFGRATVTFEVPETLPTGFELVLEARTARMRRRFSLFVNRAADAQITLHPLGSWTLPGGAASVLGFVRDARGRPAAGAEVVITGATSDPTYAPRVVVTTDAFGAFVAALEAPERAGEALHLTASALEATAQATLAVHDPSPGEVEVEVRPVSRVVPRGGGTKLRVRVIGRDGTPIVGAPVTGPRFASEEPQRVRTDSQGRAELDWTPRHGEPAVTVSLPGRPDVRGFAQILVDDGNLEAAARVEGNALLPGLSSFVYLHAVDVEGQPLVGERLALESDRFERREATTDAAGVAAVEVRVTGDDVADRCGGATAIAAVIVHGTARREVCLPTDPDGTVRVRATRSGESGATLSIERAASVRDAPIMVSVFRRDSSTQTAVSASRVEAGEDGATLDALPEGALIVRARPLIGPSRAEVRGGSTLLAPAAAPPRVRLTAENVVEVSGTARAAAMLLPSDQARDLIARFGARTDNEAASLRAARTPADEAAPAVLRDGRILPRPLPEDAAELGILRDPWRQRARYQTGRLALVIRTLEQRVASSPLEDFAHRRGAGYEFNESVLDAIAGSVPGAEGARDLGGLPLTLDALRALDPSLTFDRMARRITRERLLGALIALREFVRGRGLDLAFGRRGQPEDWWDQLGLGETATLDGWGRPLRFIARPSGARFEALEPVAGFELVSAGPDGRFGNADDVWDPTARVLPSGSLYARAMNEDGLLAQLHGVALGRSTLTQLIETDVVVELNAQQARTSAGWPLRGASFEALPFFLDPVAATPVRATSAGDEVRVGRPGEPTAGAIVALAWSGTGVRAVARDYRSESDARLSLELPERLERGAHVVLPFSILAAASLRGRVRVEAEGLEARVVGGEEFDLPEGDFIRRGLALRVDEAAANARVTVSILDASGDLVVSREQRFEVLSPEVLRTQTAEAAIAGTWPVRFELPDGVEHADLQLTVIAPSHLDRDPTLSSMRAASPALLAWAAVLSGRVPDDALLDTLRLQRQMSSLEAACALLVWTALSSEEDEIDPQLAPRALSMLGTQGQEAVVLAALASIAGSPGSSAHGGAEARVEAARATLWDGMRRFAHSPPRMARAAAALLLADPRDESGLALMQAATAALVDRDGGRALPGHPSATMALAIAASQAGDIELARALARGGARRSYVAARRGGEHAFWLLAASASGVFGREDSVAAHVVRGGRRTALEPSGGIATLTLDAEDEVDLQLEVDGGGLSFARVEATYARPEVARQEGPMTLRLEGDVGGASEIAGLELHVRARDAVHEPVVAIALPAAAVLDREALASIEGVLRVDEPDRRGLVHFHLAALAEGERRILAIPLRWLGSGTRHGLSVGAWNAARPWAISALPARELVVE